MRIKLAIFISFNQVTCLSYLILLLLLFLNFFNYNFFFNLFFSDRGPPGGQEAPSARLYRLCLGPALVVLDTPPGYATGFT